VALVDLGDRLDDADVRALLGLAHGACTASRSQTRSRGEGTGETCSKRSPTRCRRVLAETDADGVGFYVRCGFEARSAGNRCGRERFLCSRVVTAVP